MTWAPSIGMRILFRRRSLVLGIALPLAFGMGASIAVFSIVMSVLVKPLGFPDPEALVSIEQESPHLSATPLRLASANYLHLEKAVQSFQSVAAYEVTDVTRTGGGDPERLKAAAVDRRFFEVLGTFPAAGRPFLAEDYSGPDLEYAILAHGRAVILSYEYWKSRFNGSKEILGGNLDLNGKSHVVVGVMPRGFEYPSRIDVWIPLLFGAAAPNDWGGYYLGVIGRLAPGVTIEQARADLALREQEVQKAAPEVNADFKFVALRLHDKLTADLRTPLWIVFILSTVILVNVSINAALMYLAGVVSREKDMALILALGEGIPGIFGQLAVESFSIALLACAGALLSAHWGLWILTSMAPIEAGNFAAPGLDIWTVGFGLCVAAVTAALCALLPIPGLLRLDIATSLNGSGTRTSSGLRQRRLQDTLVLGQTAVSLALLVTTVLMVRSYVGIASQELNFDPSGVLSLDLTLPQDQFQSPDALDGFTTRAIEELGSIPGVEGAACALRLPILDEGAGIWFTPGSSPSAGASAKPPEYEATLNTVTPDFFRVMRIPLLRGRGVDTKDRPDGPRVVVISRDVERRFFGGLDPVGKSLLLSPWPDAPWEIVGVAADVKQGGLRASDFPAIYVPFSQLPLGRLRFVVRSSGNPAALARTAMSRIWSVKPNLSFEEVAPLDERIGRLLAPERFAMILVGAFGALGLLLSATGIYGTTAYRVGQQGHEMGIRLALGGQPRDIVLHILRNSLSRTLLGLVIGLAMAIGAGRFLSSLLYAVSPLDPLSLAGGVILMAAVTILSMYVPAIRASRADPAAALRRG